MIKHGVIAAGIVIGMVMNHAALSAAPTAPVTEPERDIRIVIDVSGSMKWNDPQNLRAPALRLITGLIPKGSRAGVWTFGRYVNMLVPLGNVDNAWKDHAKRAADDLHSRGLYTNIKDALEVATRDWKETGEKTQRSIIFLTDGLVDISQERTENDKSRALILDTVLPQIQRSRGTIYTIALSGEADSTLLQQLAAATNGRYEKAETAESLERIFFRMFEKAANPDTLPLVDNKVLVDNSIEELTLLVFRKDTASESQLVGPDNSGFGRQNAPANVNWHHEDRYDLITIDKPAQGTWSVKADVDPDNRVMVVTNLRMITTILPNNISLGDEYTIHVSLTQDDKVIGKSEFLHFVRVNMTQKNNDELWEWMLLDNGQGADGFQGDGAYAVHLDETLVQGEHVFTINVDGTTFRRENRQVINVYDSPVMAAIIPAQESNGLALTITPRAGMIEPDSMEIIATIMDSANVESEYAVPRINSNEWRLDLHQYPQDRRHSVVLSISGERPSGKPVEIMMDPLHFGEDRAADGENSPQETTETQAPPDNTAQAATEMDEEQTINWLYVSIQVLVFNLLLAIGIFFGNRAWRKMPVETQAPWDNLVHE